MATRLSKDMDPATVTKWGRLDTVGDIKRGLRWVLLSVKADRMKTDKAYCMNTIFQTLLKATEVGDLDKRLQDLETALATQQSGASFQVVDREPYSRTVQ